MKKIKNDKVVKPEPEKKIDRKHPLFVLTDFLNDSKADPEDIPLVKGSIFDFLARECYDTVTLFDNKYFLCKGTSKMTKETCVVYVRKSIDLAEVRELTKKTYDVTKESGTWCKVLIVNDITEKMKNRLLKHMGIDYIRYDKDRKKWVNSYKRSLVVRGIVTKQS